MNVGAAPSVRALQLDAARRWMQVAVLTDVLVEFPICKDYLQENVRIRVLGYTQIQQVLGVLNEFWMLRIGIGSPSPTIHATQSISYKEQLMSG